MIFEELKLKGSFLIKPEPFNDERGFFLRSFCAEEFSKNNLESSFIQMNHSGTVGAGSIRGMHFQYPPFAEVKVVKCIKGAILDVIVDLRKDSPTFLKWVGVELNEINKQSLYVPKGFAHGFQALENYVEIVYMVSQVYKKENEGGVRFDDSLIGIEWQLPLSKISDKDIAIPYLDETFKGIMV
jgi:dTDP-4-dehydrorhamnose 3,5-epimerase